MGGTLSDLFELLFSAGARHVLELGTLGRVARAQRRFRYPPGRCRHGNNHHHVRYSSPDVGPLGSAWLHRDHRSTCAPTTYSTHVRSYLLAPTASAIPILQDNVTSNHLVMSKCIPQAAVLDWEHEELPPPVQVQLEAGLDVIVYVAFSSWSSTQDSSDVIRSM